MEIRIKVGEGDLWWRMAIDIIQCNQQKNIEKEISNEQKSDNIFKILTA